MVVDVQEMGVVKAEEIKVRVRYFNNIGSNQYEDDYSDNTLTHETIYKKSRDKANF